MQIVYTRDALPKTEGRRVLNPRHYQNPVSDASKVFIDGNYPKIRADYERLGTPVADITEMRALPPKAKARSPEPDTPVSPPVEGSSEGH